MAGASNSITTHNVLSGVLNADNVISGLVNTAFNPAYALVTQAGAQIVLFINSNDYKMYAQLKDKSGNLIYTSNIIDLPLETMVVDGRYDSNTKKLILVLDNGNEIEVPLEALINGLVNEDDLIANYYDKDEIDALLNGYWTKIELTQEDIDNWNAKQEYLNQGDGIEISADTILKGNTRQESTTGKNLLNIFNFEMGAMSNGSIMSSSYRINNVNNPIEVKPNTTYCISSVLSTQVKGMRCGIHECDENMTFKKDSDWQQLATNPYVFTTENYTKYVKIVFTLSTTSTNVQTNITEDVTSYNNAVDWARGCLFQLEEGNTATSWEPYTGGNPAPNPDYPYPVNVVTGDNEVKVEGKNLCGISDGAGSTYRGITYSCSDGTIYLSGTATDIVNIDYVLKKPIQATLGTLTKSLNPSGTYTGVQTSLRKSDTSSVGLWSNNGADNTGTLTGDASLFRVQINSGTSVNCTLKPQIELGSTATTYEKHKEQTYPINLGSMELCKIGDYQDYIYKNNGNWYKYGAVNKIVFDGSEDWSSYNDYVYRGINKQGVGDLGYCDKTIFGSQNFQYASSVKTTVQAKNLVSYWGMSDTTTTTWRTYLSNNNLIFYYPIVNPTITEITDTTLIEQLDNLSIGLSNKWIKNISQTNTDLPFEIKYDNTNLTITASSNLVRNTDYATNSTGGVIKVGNAGTNINNNGYIYAGTLNYTQYNSADNSTFVGKGTLENVITGKELTNKTYVDAANAVFESELFDDGIISIEDVTKASINNTMNKSQLKINLKGNTSQESTTGANLFPLDTSQFPRTSADGELTGTLNEDGTIQITGTKTATTWSNVGIPITKNIILEAGQTYKAASGLSLVTYTEGGSWVGNLSGTINPTENYKVTSGYWATNQARTYDLTFYPMIIKGTGTIDATTWEKYTGGNPTPNPDYPYPVNVVTGDNEVKVEGKNLVDTSKSTPNKSIYASGAILNSPNINTTDYIYVGDKSSIVISFTSDLSATWNTCYFDENKNVVAGGSNGLSITAGKNGHIHTLSANQKYIRFSYPGDSQDVMLESGSSKTTFEPYKSQTYPINLGSMELCKIGDYQDYIYKENGIWYKYGAIGKVVLDGSENITLGGTNTSNKYRFNIAISGVANISGDTKASYSNNFVPATRNETYNCIQGIAVGADLIQIYCEETSSYDLNQFRTWLSNHNTTAYFPLATPTITEITDTTLIEQLDNLEKAYSYDTQTNISQTNQDKPFILDINAIADNVNGLKLENENQEYKTNKVIELSSNSTDDEYPSAKCVYDIVGNIEAVLAAMDSGSGV